MQSLSANLREIAQVMAWELEGSRLTVSLVPCRRGRRHNRIRVVEEQNPEWYRRFCAEYESERTRPRRRSKPDTAIKRANTLRALQELASGQARTVYAERLLPYVVKEAEQYEQLTRHHTWPYQGGDSLSEGTARRTHPLLQKCRNEQPTESTALLSEW